MLGAFRPLGLGLTLFPIHKKEHRAAIQNSRSIFGSEDHNFKPKGLVNRAVSL